ncbi:hypothetical protein L6452_14885 [Arctium lappa]|uniref:Uncharacterized protein n=1 Tax=Arctium lappa TaxID=4217 RepID=A0ACB9CM47_ARCLA|nr:hypothetical protein L6452_14885 [Arctium lappa]
MSDSLVRVSRRAEWGARRPVPGARIFKGRRGRTGHRATCGALPAAGPYLRLSRFQGGQAVNRQPTGSGLGPPCPALRANPFPEVTDPFCRLPLPTLFHRPEAVHLGDLMRL